MKKKYQSIYESDRAKRISIYIYPAQMKIIEEICKKRRKTKRWVFFEAVQTYIGAYREGKV